MSTNNKKRHFIILGVVLFIIAGFIVATILGKSQDEKFENDFANYTYAVDNLETGNFEMAQAALNQLTSEQTSSEVVSYISGRVATSMGEHRKAMQQMQQVLSINPYKVEDPIFMIQFAEILIDAELYLEAQEVLNICINLPSQLENSEYQEWIKKLQKKLTDSE